MNISFDWLNEYVDLGDMTPEELDDLLTFSGLEVDSMEKVETIKGGLEHVVIAQDTALIQRRIHVLANTP